MLITPCRTIGLNESVIDIQYVYDVERAYEINDDRYNPKFLHYVK